MSVMVRGDSDEIITAHVKGAPEVMLPLCNRVRVGDEVLGRSILAERHRIEQAYADMAGSGLRVLALATRAAA